MHMHACIAIAAFLECACPQSQTASSRLVHHVVWGCMWNFLDLRLYKCKQMGITMGITRFRASAATLAN